MITAQQISDYVDSHKDEAIQFLQEIVQTPSVTGNEEPVSFVFEKWMKKAGLEIQRIEAKPHRPNLCGEWFGSQKGKRLAVMGRIQVSNYEDKDGNKKTRTDIIVNEIDILDFKESKKEEKTEEEEADLPF